jgi:hypothetical protein
MSTIESVVAAENNDPAEEVLRAIGDEDPFADFG